MRMKRIKPIIKTSTLSIEDQKYVKDYWEPIKQMNVLTLTEPKWEFPKGEGDDPIICLLLHNFRSYDLIDKIHSKSTDYNIYIMVGQPYDQFTKEKLNKDALDKLKGRAFFRFGSIAGNMLLVDPKNEHYGEIFSNEAGKSYIRELEDDEISLAFTIFKFIFWNLAKTEFLEEKNTPATFKPDISLPSNVFIGPIEDLHKKFEKVDGVIDYTAELGEQILKWKPRQLSTSPEIWESIKGSLLGTDVTSGDVFQDFSMILSDNAHVIMDTAGGYENYFSFPITNQEYKKILDTVDSLYVKEKLLADVKQSRFSRFLKALKNISIKAEEEKSIRIDANNIDDYYNLLKEEVENHNSVKNLIKEKIEQKALVRKIKLTLEIHPPNIEKKELHTIYEQWHDFLKSVDNLIEVYNVQDIDNLISEIKIENIKIGLGKENLNNTLKSKIEIPDLSWREMIGPLAEGETKKSTLLPKLENIKNFENNVNIYLDYVDELNILKKNLMSLSKRKKELEDLQEKKNSNSLKLDQIKKEIKKKEAVVEKARKEVDKAKENSKKSKQALFKKVKGELESLQRETKNLEKEKSSMESVEKKLTSNIKSLNHNIDSKGENEDSDLDYLDSTINNKKSGKSKIKSLNYPEIELPMVGILYSKGLAISFEEELEKAQEEAIRFGVKVVVND